MPILDKPLSRADLLRDYCRHYDDMTKAVADLESGVMAIEAEMHSDLERLFLEAGSRQENLWGFNIYPGKQGEDFIQYTSLINIRPRAGNTSMLIENPAIRAEILSVVPKWVTDV
jgi:hypothetical protein